MKKSLQLLQTYEQAQAKKVQIEIARAKDKATFRAQVYAQIEVTKTRNALIERLNELEADHE